ncbi:DUF1549 domain-containing protein [Zavarzinella formosa]|uniref:DUF1549 domain-containing protein n=1 Tax=Zavarzinella formosa TaxID=360055 RepID=UPI001930C661|nr:DUF1549 domain-containing protein [Zavarzinella formosa]
MRNLLFLGLIAGGGLALGINILPPRHVKARTSYDPVAYQEKDFLETVHRADNSFREMWTTENVRPALPADDLTIARRLSLGLTGTVPSLEEIRQFESIPVGEQLPWWIDHLLQDKRFAAYFGERLARAFVGTEDGPAIFFRRRRFVTWLGEEITKNRPYDQIVRQVIATEGLWTDKPATNFISVTAQQEKENQPNPVRLAGRVTRAFLGLRLDCAQCHNHPFAKWKQKDFESFAAFFGQTRVGFRGIADSPGQYEVEDPKTQEKRVVEPGVAFSPELLPTEGTLREKIAGWVTHPKNPYFAKAAVNRVWAIMCGQPLLTPIDNLESDSFQPPALQILADDFSAHGYDLRRLIRVIARMQVYQLDSRCDHDAGDAAEKTWGLFPLTRLRPEQMAGSVLQASSISTLDAERHIIFRAFRALDENNFVKRYGDSGDDEFDGRGGTIPQRLVMMNGELVGEKLKEGPVNAVTRIKMLAPDDPKAVEAAYLTALTRRPTPEEAAHFEKRLKESDHSRGEHLQDLFWTLINSTEFSWNH